jgi:type III secretory pathway component EscR
MTLELILFVAAILFGIVLYWRESNGNKLYRIFNKLMYSKELQMKETDTKGFVYQQTFILRLVFVSALFLLGIIVAQFMLPISVTTVSLFMSMIVGTIVGTYVAGFIFKSTEVIDEHSDSIGDIVKETIDKGKDFIEDLKSEKKEEIVEEVKKEEAPKEEQKSARERLKDKGLL